MREQPHSSLFEREMGRQSVTYFRMLGLLPLLFFFAQAIHYWRVDQTGHMLWMCNIGNLLLAVGLFTNHSTIVRVAILWMVPGLVVWLIYVVLPWGVFLSSVLAHLGGLMVAGVALRRVGMDRRTWFYALLWFFAIQLLSRLITPARLNVNLSHRVEGAWQQSFSSYWKFWAVLSLAVAVVLWLVGVILCRVCPSIPAQNYEPETVG